MVTRRNPGRPDGHAGNGEENSDTTPETDNPLLVSAFEEGLQPGQFNESLAQRPAQSMQEIRNRADCYVKGEESNAEKRERLTSEGMNVLKTGREQGQTHQQHDRARKGYDHRGRNFSAKTNWADHQRPEPAGNYGLAAMTPLNTTRARILREVYQSDLIRLPPQAEGPKGPDMNKWCDYHRVRGHDTENCWTLMNRIERLIKEGYLGRYVEKRKDRGDRDRRRDGEGSGSRRRRDGQHKEGGEIGQTHSPKRRNQQKVTRSFLQSSTPGKISSKEGRNQLKNWTKYR
ncbi:hypothetical protein SESBI_28535 [Sesbania bispinosa]|nr:hypothetical protein SESBI_28535 [Sesbania bispinosa]